MSPRTPTAAGRGPSSFTIADLLRRTPPSTTSHTTNFPSNLPIHQTENHLSNNSTTTVLPSEDISIDSDGVGCDGAILTRNGEEHNKDKFNSEVIDDEHRDDELGQDALRFEWLQCTRYRPPKLPSKL